MNEPARAVSERRRSGHWIGTKGSSEHWSIGFSCDKVWNIKQVKIQQGTVYADDTIAVESGEDGDDWSLEAEVPAARWSALSEIWTKEQPTYNWGANDQVDALCSDGSWYSGTVSSVEEKCSTAGNAYSRRRRSSDCVKEYTVTWIGGCNENPILIDALRPRSR
jgi:hypothetical protein